jgi:membrane-associated phospholipid phosphatase
MRKARLAYKLSLLGVFGALYVLFYLWPNFLPLFAPTYLPLLEVDRAVPFLPWTFSIYLSDYVLFTVVFFLVTDLDEWNTFARMGFMTLILCGAFFLFFPTTYPRPTYPAVDNAFISFLMMLVSTSDTPNNCFPSMHVAMTSVATWNLRHRSRGVFVCFLLWSLAIFVSTLTTKQHYFVDIAGGVCAVAVVALIESFGVARGWWGQRTGQSVEKSFTLRRSP